MTRAPELLSGLDEGRTAGVMALASRIHLAPGAVLFRLGAEADVLYLVDRGLITHFDRQASLRFHVAAPGVLAR